MRTYLVLWCLGIIVFQSPAYASSCVKGRGPQLIIDPECTCKKDNSCYRIFYPLDILNKIPKSPLIPVLKKTFELTEQTIRQMGTGEVEKAAQGAKDLAKLVPILQKGQKVETQRLHILQQKLKEKPFEYEEQTVQTERFLFDLVKGSVESSDEGKKLLGDVNVHIQGDANFIKKQVQQMEEMPKNETAEKDVTPFSTRPFNKEERIKEAKLLHQLEDVDESYLYSINKESSKNIFTLISSRYLKIYGIDHITIEE